MCLLQVQARSFVLTQQTDMSLLTHTVGPGGRLMPRTYITARRPPSGSPFTLIGHSLGGKVAMEALRLIMATHMSCTAARRPPSGSPFALIGHSLGGKVAMEALRLMAEARQALPRQTWVLDSQPGLVHDDMEARSGVSHVLKVVHVSPVVIVGYYVWLLDYRFRSTMTRGCRCRFCQRFGPLLRQCHRLSTLNPGPLA